MKISSCVSRSRRVVELSRWPLLISLAGFASAHAAEDAATILKELKDFSKDGINRRLGPDYEHFHPGGGEKFSEIYLVPAKSVPPGKGWTSHGAKDEKANLRHYQWGGPYTDDSGDFSSTQGQVIYVPDNKLTIDAKTKAPNDGIGIDRVTMIEWSNNCFTEKPEPPWWGGFRPEPTASVWTTAMGDKIGVPFAEARGQGSWSNSGMILFSSGFMAPAGTVTAGGTNPTFTFPANKLPTAISLTSKSEFALVTVIDTEKKIGQLAVFALSSNGKKASMPHEWNDDYPGMPNVAVFSGIKLLGYVDLPGMNFPTGVCGVSAGFGGRLNGRNGHAGMLSEFDLSNQADRDLFNKGDNSQFTATFGCAAVISKYEGKVAFLDLQPLFERYREAYFTTAENFKKTREMGPGPKQWPFTFEGDPSLKPSLVKMLEVPRPTAVIVGMYPGGRAYVASEEGNITAYNLGGLSTKDAADPSAVAAAGTLKVGRNPICLTYAKYTSDTFIVVSRGDRELSWVTWGDKPQITRTLRDSRLVDPVCAEVPDTHGIESQLVTVVDFKGRKIANYRYGLLVFATQGGAKFDIGRGGGKDEFECGGILEFPGHPFVVSATNVN